MTWLGSTLFLLFVGLRSVAVALFAALICICGWCGFAAYSVRRWMVDADGETT